MLMTSFVVMVTLAMFTPAQGAATLPGSESSDAGYSWLLSYQGKTTNQVRWDDRFPKLLQSGLPDVRANFYDPNKPLPEVALVALSGPPEEVSIESSRYVTLAACVPHVGELKGLLWVDAGSSEPEMVFAALDQDAAKPARASLALFTRSSRLASKLPPQFVSSLTAWLTHVGIKHVTNFTMTNQQGRITNLSPSVLGSY